MNKQQFYETYCMCCGTQHCGGIDDEVYSSGCLYRWNLDGVDAATEIIRLNDKIMELAGVIMKLRAQGMWKIIDSNEYGFEVHKGYGTKEHTDLILKYGPCKIHRMSFLKKLLGDKK